ncbi:MAG: hypothetical protein IJL78_09455 [Lachnospiraceae bacterium]|nr:hypothetical protein [Lachnospiraceae bacterium]
MAKVYGDEITGKDQWNKLKGAPLKDKISYIWEYYHIHIIIAVALIVFAVSMIRSIIYNSIPNVVDGEFLMAEMLEDDTQEELKEILCEKLGYEAKKYHIDLSSTALSSNAQEVYTLVQKVIARIAAQDLDFIAAPEAYFSMFMSPEDEDSSAFADLRTVLSEETVARLEAAGRLRYFENDYTDPYPYLIDITDCEFYRYLGFFSTECYMGITVNAPHPEALEAILTMVE